MRNLILFLFALSLTVTISSFSFIIYESNEVTNSTPYDFCIKNAYTDTECQECDKYAKN